jgi:hypothetical protein
MNKRFLFVFWKAISVGITCLALSACPLTDALAQEDDEIASSIPRRSAEPTEYAFTEDGKNARFARNAKKNGPVRLAYFSYVQGDVSLRTDENASWASASINLPIRQNAQIWVAEKGRAEVQFDDGTLLRLAANTLVTFQTLHSDSEGAFTLVKLSSGLASLYVRHEHTTYQVDTPFVSVRTSGPSRVRIGAGDAVEIAVRQGSANIEGAQGKIELLEGDYLFLEDAEEKLEPRAIPRPDSWERWVEERDQMIDRPQSPSKKHLPENLALVAPNLDEHGDWQHDREHGYVWRPRNVTHEWRPYQDGRWTWVNPFGWTWVSNEPWGWAPYHYGTWVSRPIGWVWVPGPVTQYWSPAIVHFIRTGNQIVWVPLAPGEVRYPARIDIAFNDGSWFRYFSIGQAAVYYPINNVICEPRPWSNAYVNSISLHNTAALNMQFVQNGNQWQPLRFVPRNGFHANGATITEVDSFGSTGIYRGLPRSLRALFGQSDVVASPPSGFQPVAGPSGVQPNSLALTPSRILNPRAVPPPQIMQRSIYRGVLPAQIQRQPIGYPGTRTGRSSAAERLNQQEQGFNPTVNGQRNPQNLRNPNTPVMRRDSSYPTQGTRPANGSEIPYYNLRQGNTGQPTATPNALRPIMPQGNNRRTPAPPPGQSAADRLNTMRREMPASGYSTMLRPNAPMPGSSSTHLRTPQMPIQPIQRPITLPPASGGMSRPASILNRRTPSPPPNPAPSNPPKGN